MRTLWLLAVVGVLTGCPATPDPGDGDGGEPFSCPPGQEEPIPGSETCRPMRLECPVAQVWSSEAGGCVEVGPTRGCGDWAPLVEGTCVSEVTATPCEPGSFQVPGLSACEPLLACPTGAFQAPPAGATKVVYVDPAFTGIPDGSESAPFVTLADALAASPTVVLLAAGTYPGPVGLTTAVEVIGACPTRTVLQGDSSGPAVTLSAGARVAGVTVKGPGLGVHVVDASGWRLEGVHIDGTGNVGLEVEGGTGEARRLSITGAGERGIRVASGTASFTDIEVIGGVVLDAAEGHHSFEARQADGGPPSVVTLSRARIVGQGDTGVAVIGSTLTAEDLYAASGENPAFGVGIAVGVADLAGIMGSLDLRHAVVVRSRTVGIAVWSSKATLRELAILDTQPGAATRDFGHGLHVNRGELDAGISEVLLEDSLVSGGREAGVLNVGSVLTLRRVRVTGVQPTLNFDTLGWGVGAQSAPRSEVHPTLALEQVSIDHVYTAGVALRGGTHVMTDLQVTDVSPEPVEWGSGLGLVSAPHPSAIARQPELTVDGMRVERGTVVGLYLLASKGTITDVAVGEIQASPEFSAWGDGIVVSAYRHTSSPLVIDGDITLVRPIVRESARAGVTLFGTKLSLSGAVLDCNVFDLNTDQEYAEGEVNPFELIDLGDNVCGCGDTVAACRAESLGLFPAPVPDEL